MLDAVPLQASDPLAASAPVVFDAVKAWAGFGAMQATEYMFSRHVNETTTMAMMQPGYDFGSGSASDPPLTKSPKPQLIDYIVKERLFNFFMPQACQPGTQEHALMERIATQNPWPKPIVVFGYNSEKHAGANYYGKQ